ncbi:LamG domain-containing protein [Psychroserpens algicola]|uniref:LamG domain-containing protein n=1 Tax=Psychroserpens algicola TaxID=1719034 RepID=A0ABT0HCY7_9FLAO|nr:LamG domain-containing protein [Psychroserpens algicola]MCK8481720.1 LamG domain-containing protein [Psychroserpens algicola]
MNDESGNNNNLINNTTASSTTDRNGNLNCAFGFNPSNGDFLENNDTSFLDDLHVDGFSISFWYMAIDDTGSALFISRDDENNECGYIGQWSIHYVDENFFFGANGKRGIGHHISVLDWEHIVLTIDGTNLRFYKNGVLEAEELNSPFESCTTNPTINDGDLFIGRFFDGKMDDIIIYDRVLTPTEATELFNTSACCN